jgi:hypothetical protein
LNGMPPVGNFVTVTVVLLSGLVSLRTQDVYDPGVRPWAGFPHEAGNAAVGQISPKFGARHPFEFGQIPRPLVVGELLHLLADDDRRWPDIDNNELRAKHFVPIIARLRSRASRLACLFVIGDKVCKKRHSKSPFSDYAASRTRELR